MFFCFLQKRLSCSARFRVFAVFAFSPFSRFRFFPFSCLAFPPFSPFSGFRVFAFSCSAGGIPAAGTQISCAQHFVITSEFPNHHSSIQVPSKDFWTESQVSCPYEIVDRDRLIIVSISIRDRRPAGFFLGIDRVPNSAFSRPVAPAQR